jgi:hypothetical protein
VTRDGIGQISDPVYVSNNTGGATTDPGYVGPVGFGSDGCGNGRVVTTYLQKNRDYYVNVAKPNWRAYTYPHPLRGYQRPSFTAASSRPPQDLRIGV